LAGRIIEVSLGRDGTADGAALACGCTSSPLSTGATTIAVVRAYALAMTDGAVVGRDGVDSAAGAAPQSRTRKKASGSEPKKRAAATIGT
jgi:hypothetical protein